MQVPLMLLRSICTSAVRYSRNGIPTVIKEFPITLRISLPHYDEPVSFSFTSFADISEFLAPKDFFIHPSSRRAIRYNQVKDVNPNVVYDWFSGWMCYDQNLPLRERVKDVAPFDKQAISTLKTILAKEDPSFKELPGKGVVKDKEGKVVAEWKAIFQLSDGCVVFLEAQHHMTISHVNNQSERMLKSLQALGKQGRAKLFLAAYYWHHHLSCIPFTHSKGYGTIRPDVSGRKVIVEAAVEQQLLNS